MFRFSTLLNAVNTRNRAEYVRPTFSNIIQRAPIEIAPPTFDGASKFNDQTVTVGIATFPARVDNLRICVDSLYDQCDHICIYLNGYTEVPKFLKRPKILSFLSTDYLDINATGKVFFIDWAQKGFYFTIDDDFVYPSNYISRMKSKIELYDRRCAVTVHGSIFPQKFSWYYERTAMYQYQAPLPNDHFVHLPGSGSFGFHKSTLAARLVDFLPNVMVDLTFAILCKRQQIPVVSISRPAMWMMNTERSGLFQQFRKTITHHTTYAIEEQPWSFENYVAYAGPIIGDVFRNASPRRLLELGVDIDFITAMRKAEVPSSWKDTMTTMRRKMDVLTSDFN